MNRHGTDKLYAHHYDEEYIRHFTPLRDCPVKLLEIGIGGYDAPHRGGESLKVWRDYFQQGRIVGIDIEDKSFCNAERITTIICDQSDPDQLRVLSTAHGPFDIIIDDGSHIQEHIRTSFHTLFPLLNSGGVYVIEDMATAYHPGYGGCQDHFNGHATSLEMLADLIDGLHWHFWRDRGPSDLQRLVKSIHISRELAFIYKH